MIDAILYYAWDQIAAVLGGWLGFIVIGSLAATLCGLGWLAQQFWLLLKRAL